MNEKVRVLLVEFLSNSTIITSWGITDIEVTESCVSFLVNAFKYSGRLIIKNCNDVNSTYEIEYTALNRLKVKADISNIIEMIDRKIEASDTYKEDIVEWIDKRLL